MREFIKNITYIKKDQNGFSLIELIAAIGISSVIIIGLVISIFELFNGHARSSGEMNVVRQVQQAGYYISRDIHQTKYVSLVDDPGTAEVEKVTLNWFWYFYNPDNPADRDGEGNRVIYTLKGDKLYRNFYFANVTDRDIVEDDYVLISTTFIAEYITDIGVVLFLDENYYALTVTASVDGIAGEQTETRIYEIKRRPNVL